MSVSRIILNSKAQYAKAYLHTEQDENDLTYFIIYNLKCIDKALVELRHYIKRKTAEKQNALTLLRHTSFNERQVIILQELMVDSTLIFTVQQVQNKFGVSNQTARNDLNGLAEQGIFEERRSGHRIQFLPKPDFMKKIMKK
jgi:Fic family protein